MAVTDITPEPAQTDPGPSWWERRRERRQAVRQGKQRCKDREAEYRCRAREQQQRMVDAAPAEQPERSAGRRNVPATLLAGAMLAVELIVAAESFRGLVGFAHLIGITGVAAYGVPVTLDGVAMIAALLALRAELGRESSGLYRLTLFAFTGASAAANYWHGARAGGVQAALYLGGMSLAVAWLFTLSLRQIRVADRRAAGMVTERLPKFSGWHWTRFPRRTFRAWSLAVRDGHETARAALGAADAAQLPAVELDAALLAAMPVRDRLTVAFGAVGAVDVPQALALLERLGVPADDSQAYQVRKALLAGAKGGDQS